jgi:hypothetical protein
MNRLYSSAEAGRAAPIGRLRLARCADCGFTWNLAFDPDLIVYDEHYENDQTLSGVFKEHAERRAREVISAADPLRYLEIGCGQGSFLGLVARLAGTRLEFAEGFDPAWRGAEGQSPSQARIHKSYFTPESSSRIFGAPNVVALRLTIAHVVEPVAFLRTIRAALGDAADAMIFVETPCVDWVFRQNAVQDLCYEHCSNFTARALATALLRAGYYGPEVGHVFGGQYLWARARTLPCGAPRPTPEPLAIADLASRREAFITDWDARVSQAALRGRCAIWGAGAKGVNFALMMAKGAQPIDHAVDINPGKQNLHLPGSGLAVLSPSQSVARNVDTYFVMNPNYLDEIAALLETFGARAELVPPA